VKLNIEKIVIKRKYKESGCSARRFLSRLRC